MPIVLDDAVLVPPSLRRGHPARYYNSGTSTTIIETSDRHVPRRPLTPPRSPVFIHQETTTYAPSNGRDSLEEFRGEVEYVTPGSRRRLYYAGSEPGRTRHRSLSVGEYDSGVDPSRHRGFIDEDYYLEDGSRHSHIAAEYDHHRGPHVVPVFHGHGDYPGPNESERHHRHVRHLAQAGLATGALGVAKEIHSHRARHREHHSDSSDEGHHNHRGRNAAAAAVVATAAGIAAHQIYQRRHRSRSSDSHPSHSNSHTSHSISHTSDSDHHTGKKIAGAALGATAAGIAAHKIHQHRRKSRTGSISSRSSSSDREGHHHRGAKLAAGTAAVLGTGLAAKHVHRRRHSRSRSSSRSHPKVREPWGRHVAAAALGTTAAGLAHHEYKHHHNHHERPRPVLRRSYSDGGFREHGHKFHRRRSPSPRKHSKLNKAAATAAAAVVAKKAIDHYRHERGRSVSTSPERRGLFHRRSHSRSRSRPRVGVPEALAAGVIGAGLAAHREHQERKREHEVHGGGVAVPISDHHHSHVHYSSSPRYACPDTLNNCTGYTETITLDRAKSSGRALSLKRPRRRRASTGLRVVEGLMDHLSGATERRKKLGHGLSRDAFSYRLGHSIAKRATK